MHAGAACWHAFPTAIDSLPLNHKSCFRQGASCQVFGHISDESN